MGFFSTLGKIGGTFFGGPTGGAIGGGIGSLIDGKRAGSSASRTSDRNYRNQLELAKYQSELNKLDLGRLSKEARENGFNPLTVLGYTGGQGFTGGAVTPPALASGDFVTEAMERSVTNWYNNEPLFNKSEEDELRVEMMREELKDLQRRNKAPLGGFGYDIQQVTTQSRNQEGLEPLLDPGRATTTNASHIDAQSYIDPRSPDAEMAEARYGDVAQEVGGVVNTLRDFGYNRKLQKIVRKHGKEVADKVHELYGSDASLTFEQAVRKVIPPRLGVPSKNTTKGRAGSAMTSH
ncbi:hypothetical protein [Roseobacter sp. MH60115]|uniref:hypothetical protein n=1 Tax=Roseobacter sp. MH60115 TaxID=2785324 RepID=UPI0018A2FBD7|nr:hypothetical protein [Roseobacter sp. MH60115]